MATPSAREAIVEQLFSILQAVATAQSTTALPVTATRSVHAAFSLEDGIGLVVRPKAEESQDRTRAPDTGLKKLEVEILTVARGEVPDQVADPVIVAFHAAIMADRSLGNRCSLISELSTDWEFQVANFAGTAINSTYRVLYAQLTGDLTARI